MFLTSRWKTIGTAMLAAAFAWMASSCSQSIDGDKDPSSELRPEQRVNAKALNEPPVADFKIIDELPEDGDPVSFDGSLATDPDGDVLTYAWRFGDETPGGGEKISHIYAEGGDFEVTLTVSDEHGATSSVTKTVSIKDTPFLRGEATVTIMARDMNYHDVDGVTISPVGSDISKTTGKDGTVTFENMPQGEPLVFEATKDGYAKQVARVRLPDNAAKAPLLIRMQKIGKVVKVDNIEEGGEVHGQDGARLDFPRNAVVDSEGNPVTGEITVEFTNFDISDEPRIDGFPGAFLGLRYDGSVDAILSFGAMEVNLKKEGEDLQVKPGETVEMDIPAYAEGVPMKADIPLWSLDESTGIWVEEGRVEPVENDASPTGRVLRTEVTHFTTWNGDYPLTTPCKMQPKCMINDKQGNPTIPLKPGEVCTVKVTSSKLPGLGSSCSIGSPQDRVAGKSCAKKNDCYYEKQVQNCTAGDTCTTKTKKIVPPGITCNTAPLPGGQSIPGGGVCKKTSSTCPGAQFCSSGACSLPASGGVFAGATGRFNQKFQISPKGGSVTDLTPPNGQPGGWIWVPNTDLQLRGLARKGTLHGATNVEGHDNANKAFKDGDAKECKEARPLIGLNHECQNGISGLTGNCPDVKRRHFCELLFKCPEAEFSRSFTRVLGVPNVQECRDKLENDYDLTLLKQAISTNRASFNGNRAAKCLDDVAALRKQVVKAIGNGVSRRKACAKFDAKAFEINACTGVEGSVAKGKPCAHDLECRDAVNQGNKVNRSCVRDDVGYKCVGVCKTDVASDRTCGTGNKTCGFGEYCDNGQCVAKKTTVGAKCGNTGECRTGLYCNRTVNKCQPRSFSGQPSQSCDRQNLCAIGLKCSPKSSSGGNVCRAFSKPGGSCFEHAGGGSAGCIWYAFCNGNKCVQKKTHNENCEADYQCLSGTCRRANANATGTCVGPQQALACP